MENVYTGRETLGMKLGRDHQNTTETGRPQIQRQAWQLTSVPNVNDFGHVALFVKLKR